MSVAENIDLTYCKASFMLCHVISYSNDVRMFAWVVLDYQNYLMPTHYRCILASIACINISASPASRDIIHESCVVFGQEPLTNNIILLRGSVFCPKYYYLDNLPSRPVIVLQYYIYTISTAFILVTAYKRLL